MTWFCVFKYVVLGMWICVYCLSINSWFCVYVFIRLSPNQTFQYARYICWSMYNELAAGPISAAAQHQDNTINCIDIKVVLQTVATLCKI